MKTTTPAVLLMLGLLGVVPAAVRAETTLCTVIATLPSTISAPGVYCLNSDFAVALASGNAITIAANNVTLDLNAHKIGNLAAGKATAAVGIYAINQQNITVKNGIVRGFAVGIELTDSANPPASSQGHLVDSVRVDQNTQVAIEMLGRGSIVRSNQVVTTGGSTSVANAAAVGISVAGASNRVLDNDVTDTQAVGSGNALAIQAAGAEGVVVQDNRVSGVVAPGGGQEYAIDITTSPQAQIRDNLLNNASVPTNATLSIGISMDDATDKYMGNLASGFGTSYSGGTDATGTNF